MNHAIPREWRIHEGVHPHLSYPWENPIPMKISTLLQGCTRTGRGVKVREHDTCVANLLPSLIQHYCTANRDSCFVLHEGVECLFVIVTPLV